MKKVNTRIYANDEKIGAAYIIFLLLFVFTIMWANMDCSEDYLKIEREYKSVTVNGLHLGDANDISRNGSVRRSYYRSGSCSLRPSAVLNKDNQLDGAEVPQEVSGFHSLVGNDSAEQIKDEIIEGQIEMTAQLIEAEAGNQDFKGKCLVADVVYNRVKSGTFPNDIESVIFQYLTDKYGDKHYQFSTVIDGSYENAGWYISEDSFKAAYQEYYTERRIDDRILYFTAGSYNPFCIPAYKYGDHYFGY